MKQREVYNELPNNQSQVTLALDGVSPKSLKRRAMQQILENLKHLRPEALEEHISSLIAEKEMRRSIEQEREWEEDDRRVASASMDAKVRRKVKTWRDKEIGVRINSESIEREWELIRKEKEALELLRE